MAKTKTKKRGRERGEGLGKVREAASRSGGNEWLKLGDGDTAIVRVLRDTWDDLYVHRTPIEGENGRYFADVPCLDQEDKGIKCPGCADDLKKRYKFYVYVIARDWEGEDGKAKPKDTLLMYSGGITVAKRLDKIDAKKSLANHDIEIEREGSTKDDTSYNIDPVDDDPEPLTTADKKLAEKAKGFKRYTELPEFDDFYLPFSERFGDKDDDEDVGEKSRRRGSAFSKNKGKNKRSRARDDEDDDDDSDDDDEDDEDERPARRKSSSSSKKGKAKKLSSKSKSKTKVRRRRS